MEHNPWIPLGTWTRLSGGSLMRMTDQEFVLNVTMPTTDVLEDYLPKLARYVKDFTVGSVTVNVFDEGGAKIGMDFIGQGRLA